MVCLIANITPEAETKSQRFPEFFLGLQFVFKKSSSLVENIEPIKTAWGVISIPESLKSKSTLVIPTLQMFSSPQKDATSISFF